MKNVIRVACCLPLMFSFAHAKPMETQPLDNVSLMLSAQRWVSTDTAKLDVTINATLTQASLVQMRQDILKKLNTIAKGDWHILQFNRSQNSSGLESLYANATVRVPQSILSGVNEQAKKVSQPGVQYTVSNIDFSPSKQDVQRVEALVRQDLYEKVNNEVSVLNKTYTSQNYSVNRVIISMPGQSNAMHEKLQRASRKNRVFAVMNSPSSDVSVSNKVVMNAFVSMASNRYLKK